MNKRKLGENYEQIVRHRLQTEHVKVLEMNYRNRIGEIDLIVRDEEYLVFVEVKFRKNRAYGLPEEAVGYKKQKTICQVAKWYMYEKRIYTETPIRFDVISIEDEIISWYKNAFDFIY